MIGIASMGLAAAGAALVWIYLVPFIGLAPDLTAGMSAQEAEILRLVNDERKRAGAPALKSSQRLMLASRGHSYDMALRNYLGHKGPAGDTPAERVRGVGVDSAAFGENLYLDREADRARLAERAVQEWLRNPEHRANLLSPDFASTGVGIARAADGTAYVTQDFAR
ncbi:MAG TPA: CAP domain-containing protein [Candidatus Binataceae bacterium]|nr:CAP domain-containing protein [Candidatus Binataceae bacterium]